MSVSRPRSPSVDCAICLLWLAAALPGLACGGRSPLDPRSPIPLTGATEGGRNGGATAGAGGAAGSTGRRPGLRLVAGKLGGAGDLDGVGAAARFRAPFAVAADGSGQLFVSDRASHVIRRIDIATGRVSTLAGLPGSAGSKDGSGTAARFRAPAGITSDRAGNLFVADADNHTIRKIVTATGAVSTVAGSPEEGGSEDGSASTARFSGPLGVVWDRSGALFVADTNNNVVRRIELASDVVTTLAGEAERGGSTDGTGSSARFSGPSAIASDGAGRLFVVDALNGTIRTVVVATGAVSTLAGSPPPGHGPGQTDGTGADARFILPNGIAMDASGDLFVVETFGCTLRRVVVTTAEVTTLVGSPDACGSRDGIGTAARLDGPTGVASDDKGHLFIADQRNHTVRTVVTATAEVSTLAGAPESGGKADGTGEAARFMAPRAIASDGEGNLFVADHELHQVVVATGVVTGFPVLPGAGRLPGPNAVAADGRGQLFVSEVDRINRVVISTGAVSTLSPTPVESLTSDGGNGLFAWIDSGVLAHIDATTGAVTALAGARVSGSADGIGEQARFANPRQLAADGDGNVFVADTGNHIIRKLVVATRAVTTLAGAPGASGSTDGTGGGARFDAPVGLVHDGHGHLFVGDVNNHTLRRIVIATGEVTTVAGTPGRMGAVSGPLPGGLSNPTALAMGTSGEVLIGDSSEHAILAVSF